MEKNYKLKIYWNAEENTPVILEEKKAQSNKNLRYMTSDIRPVFILEKHLLKSVFENVLDEKVYTSEIWVNKQGKYFIDGKIFNFSITSESKKIADKSKFVSNLLSFIPTQEYLEIEKKQIEKFVRLNFERYKYITEFEGVDEEGYIVGAYPFVKQMTEKYSTRINVVSFSGGKDSTVVSHIVRKALNKDEVLHVFGDTTLEFPLTYNYLERFKDNNPFIPFIEERNYENNFFEICDKIGPPSRVKSWCCSIFKTGPMGTTFAEIDAQLLTFYGIRRNESVSRSKYLRVSKSPKIEKQIVASPIIDWLDADIWLYILTEKLDFNDAYRQGFARVGCWCCPNNSYWSDFLMSIYNHEQYDKWRNFLLEFSKRIGKEDYETYVDDGKWKARQGGTGIELAKRIRLSTKECIAENNSKSYELNREIDDEFFEMFKPFGKINFEFGNSKIGEVYILNRNNEIDFKLLAKKGSKKVRITIVNNKEQHIFSKIENQLRKFNTCIYCKACNSSCPIGALSVSLNAYKIDENLCTHCLKCVTHFNMGCLIASSLVIKKE